MTTKHSSVHLASEGSFDTLSTDSLSEMRSLVSTYAEDPNGAVLDGWEPREGTIITEVRAISARINQNFDAWPSDELREAHHTFVGKPVFVNHNNHDPDRARGRVVASRYVDAGEEDRYVQVLQEVEATRFPMLAKELMEGGLDSVSMGAEAREVECSFCANISTSPFDACEHIPMKGSTLQRRTASGQPEDVLIYEVCRKISFFELSYVFDPADETAVASNVLVANRREAVSEIEVPTKVDTLHPNEDEKSSDDWQEYVDDPNVIDTIDVLDEPDLGLNQELERPEDEVPEGFEEFEGIDDEIAENEQAEEELAQESREKSQEKADAEAEEAQKQFEQADPEVEADDPDSKDPEDEANWEEEEDGAGGLSQRFKGAVEAMVANDYGTFNMWVEKNGSLVASDSYPSLAQAKAAAVEVAKNYRKHADTKESKMSRTSRRKQAGASNWSQDYSGALEWKYNYHNLFYITEESDGYYLFQGTQLLQVLSTLESAMEMGESAAKTAPLPTSDSRRKQADLHPLAQELKAIFEPAGWSPITSEQFDWAKDDLEFYGLIGEFKDWSLEDLEMEVVDSFSESNAVDAARSALEYEREEYRQGSRKQASALAGWDNSGSSAVFQDRGFQLWVATEDFDDGTENWQLGEWSVYDDTFSEVASGQSGTAEAAAWAAIVAADDQGFDTSSVPASGNTDVYSSRKQASYANFSDHELISTYAELENDLQNGVDESYTIQQMNAVQDEAEARGVDLFGSNVASRTSLRRNGSRRTSRTNDRDISRKESHMAPQRRRRIGDNKQTPLLEETGIAQTPAEEPVALPEEGDSVSNSSESDRVKSARRALVREVARDRARKARRRQAGDEWDWSAGGGKNADDDFAEFLEKEKGFDPYSDDPIPQGKLDSAIDEFIRTRGDAHSESNYDSLKNSYGYGERWSSLKARRQAKAEGEQLSGASVKREDLFQDFPATTMTAKVRKRFATWVRENYGVGLRQASGPGELRSWARAFSKESNVKLPTLHAAIKRDVMALRTAADDEGVSGDNADDKDIPDFIEEKIEEDGDNPSEDDAKEARRRANLRRRRQAGEVPDSFKENWDDSDDDDDEKKEARRKAALRRRRAAQAQSARGRRTQTTRRRTADEKLDLAAPGDRVNVEKPTSGTTDDEAEASQFDKSDFDNNSGKGLENPDTTPVAGTPGGPSVNDLKKSARASGLQAVQLAEAMIAANLIENTREAKFKAAAQFEKMSRDIVLDRTALLEKVVTANAKRPSTKSAGNRGASLNSAVPPNLSGATRPAPRQVEAASDSDSDLFF